MPRDRAPSPRPSWALRFIRNALLWVVPVALLWLLITPVYNRFLLGSAENLVHLTEYPSVTDLLRKDDHFAYEMMKTTFFLSRRSLKASKTSGLPPWQDKIFIPLARNADDASSYFGIPTDRVVELGTQVTI